MPERTFILASSSPRRQELLTTLRLRYIIIKPDIDETPLPDETPLAHVERLSRAKAQAVAERYEWPAAILAADTVVILAADTIGIDDAGALLGKPGDADDARTMLRRLRGRPHEVHTAFTLMGTGDEPFSHTERVRTVVTMRRYSDAEIDAYIATGDPFDKAGSYAIQHPTFRPVARIDGSYSNVVGLPMDEVRAALLRYGLLDELP